MLDQEIIRKASDHFGSVIQLSPILFWLIFLAVFAVTAFQAAIIVYHWYVYAPNKKMGANMLLLYTVVSGVLLILSVIGGFSIIAFT